MLFFSLNCLPHVTLQELSFQDVVTMKILIHFVRNLNYETVQLGGKGRNMTGWPANSMPRCVPIQDLRGDPYICVECDNDFESHS